MKTLLVIFCCLIAQQIFSQSGPVKTSFRIDSTVRKDRRMNAGPAIFIAEVFIVGTSYYAAKPQAHGDRVIGWFYLLSSAGMLAYTPAYFFNKENKEDRIWNAVTMVGLSYGFYRIASYNLWHSNSDSFETRFKRNILESHIAYIVPVALGAVAERILDKRGKKKSKAETSFQLGPTSVYFSVRF